MNHPTDDPTTVLADPTPPAFPPGMTAFDTMTTRDLFAAFALQGILSGHAGEGVEPPRDDTAAKRAFQYADAMLARRNTPFG